MLAALLAILLTTAVPLAAQGRSREQGTVRGSSPSTPSSPSSPSASGVQEPRPDRRAALAGRAAGRQQRRRPRPANAPAAGIAAATMAAATMAVATTAATMAAAHSSYPWYPRYGSYWGIHYGYPWGWWPWYYGAYDGPYQGGYRGGYYDEGEMGALDLDVSPGRTEVHLDGQFVGTVDAFDGWPQYLWLDKGTYDLVLYLDGYRTVAKQITVYPGVVLDVGDRLEPGDSVRPEDIPTKTHDRRDARLEQDREMREKAARERLSERERMEEWRERARERRGAIEDDEEEDEDGDDEVVGSASTAEDGQLDVRGEPGRVRVSVEPGDASIYLDGRFIGTGDDLARLHSGLLVDAGEHRLAVVRPGRQSEEREFRVAAGQEVELEIELSSN